MNRSTKLYLSKSYAYWQDVKADILYVTQKAIKGQALVDHLEENSKDKG